MRSLHCLEEGLRGLPVDSTLYYPEFLQLIGDSSLHKTVDLLNNAVVNVIALNSQAIERILEAAPFNDALDTIASQTVSVKVKS